MPAAGKPPKHFASACRPSTPPRHRSGPIGLGFDASQFAEHYLGPARRTMSRASGAGLAALPAMCFAPAATNTLRIGSRMLCVDYHVSAVLAKEAAMLDLLSGGRLELGLGAGWLEAEYSGMGLRLGPAKPGSSVSPRSSS